MDAGSKIDLLFKAFDMFFFNLFGSLQNAFLTKAMQILTLFGDARLIIAVIAAGLIMCIFKKTRKLGLCLFIALVLSTVITNVILKPSIMRLRPYVTLQNDLQFMKYYAGAGKFVEPDYSFPSGHTTAAFTYCTVFFVSLFKKHKVISFAFPLIAVAVMISRVYLMVHYASDVIFGMAVGIICALVSYAICEKICKTKVGAFNIGEAAERSV